MMRLCNNLAAGGLLATVVIACGGCVPSVPASRLMVSQRQASGLYSANRAVTAERDSALRVAASTATQRDRYAGQAAELQTRLAVSDKRLRNLLAERGQLQQRYVSLLNRGGGSPLGPDATLKLQDLAERYPDLEFDPHTGVSKFHADILFASASDQLRDSARGLLQELADVLNYGETERLKLLVVGHTDDKPISHRRGTNVKHPTNWHLSTNRANAVVLALSKFGVRPGRLGAMGYSKHQPVVHNSNDESRQMNRRVEIYVLAPDNASIARWHPGAHRG